MSPLLLVGLITIAILAPTSADVKHVLEGSAHPPTCKCADENHHHYHTNQAPDYHQGFQPPPPPGQDAPNAVPGSVAFWWSDSNSPFKHAYDHFKKCSLKGNCFPQAGAPPESGCGVGGCTVTGSIDIKRPGSGKASDVFGPIDIQKNPYLNGQIQGVSGPMTATTALKPNKIDLSKNPFFQGHSAFSGTGQTVSTGADGFLGVQPAVPFGNDKKPFPTTYPGQPGHQQPGNQFQPQPGSQSQPQPGSQFQPQPGSQFQPQPGSQFQPQPGSQFQPQPGSQFQPQPGSQFQPQPGSQFQPQQPHHPGSQIHQGNQFQNGNQFQSGNQQQPQPFPSTHPGVQPGRQQFENCKQPDYYCVRQELCANGVVKTQGQGIIEQRFRTEYCEIGKEVCCHVPEGVGSSYKPTNGFNYATASISGSKTSVSSHGFSNLSHITVGKSSVPGSTIKFGGGAGISPGVIQVLAPENNGPNQVPAGPNHVSSGPNHIPNPLVTSAGESGSDRVQAASSISNKVVRNTSPNPNSVFASTIDYSNENFDGFNFQSSDIQGPQYLPPISSPPFVPSSPTPFVPQPQQPVTVYTPTPHSPEYIPAQPSSPKPFTQPSTPRPNFPTSYIPPRTSQYIPPSPSTYKPYQPSPSTVRPYQTPKPYVPPSPTPRPYVPPAPTPKPYVPPAPTPRPYVPPSPSTYRPYVPPSPSTYRPYVPPSPSTYRPYSPPSTYRPTPQPSSYRPSVTQGYSYPTPTPAFEYPTPNQGSNINGGYVSRRPTPKPLPSTSGNQYLPPQPTPGYSYPTPSPPFNYPSPSTNIDFNNNYVTPKPTPIPTRATTRRNQYLPPDEIQNPSDQSSSVIRPPNPNEPSLPHAGCAAALRCVQEIYCSAEGVISQTPVVLSKQQELLKVPTTDCLDKESGIVGKCCRDPNYVDPWPSANLINGEDDGQYREDPNLGQYFPQHQRPVRSESSRNQRLVRSESNASTKNSLVGRTQQPSQDEQCGLRNPNGNPKGPAPLNVAFAEIPWQAMVLRDGNRSLLCGGVIVKRNAVLTAAHCVDGLATSDVLIKGGEWKLGIDEEPLPFQIVKVAAIIRHPSYQRGSFLNDLALLMLEEPLRLAKNIGPICLPPSNQPPSGQCITTGWGKRILQVHLRGAIMKSVDVFPLDSNQCQQTLSSRYQHVLQDYSPENTLCAYSQNDQCDVDYGSAMACTNSNGQYTLAGIFSWDTGCKDSSQIGGYVPPDVEWIESTCSKPLTHLRALDREYRKNNH